MLAILKPLMNKKVGVSVLLATGGIYLGHWLYSTGYANGKTELLEDTLAAHQDAMTELRQKNQDILDTHKGASAIF